MVLLLAGLWLACSGTAVAETVRLRLAWGGGSERTWQGRIAISGGALSDPIPLGIEADEAGSMWLETTPVEVNSIRNAKSAKRGSISTAPVHVAIRQRSPRTYDSVDLVAGAAPETTLYVELNPTDDHARPGWIEVRLADVLHGGFHTELDDRGNRLVVRRSPGDELRVKLASKSLVFQPGETLKYELRPFLTSVEQGIKLRLHVELLAARSSRQLWAVERTFTAGDLQPISLEVPLPKEEGVYDVLMTAFHAGLRLPSVRGQLGWKTPLVERTVQVIVLSDKAPSGGEGQLNRAAVVEIDPTNPKTPSSRFSVIPSRHRPKAPLGSGQSQTIQHPLGAMTRLAPNEPGSEPNWEAYTLSINRPGEPHVLEVEYPSDVPQTLGISVIEPNPAGAVFPLGLDSGIDLAEEVASASTAPEWNRHRLVFWPRTKSPMVLLVNRRDREPAFFGKVRVLAGWQRLPRTVAAGEAKSGRLLGAYLDRPLLPENFSASEVMGSQSELGITDWVTFHESGTRLVDYLQYAGFNALMLGVLADGSTIYPSDLVEPTPRYDTGALFGTGQDPVRKDVLEMLLRLFDREGLSLIPAIEFGTPLPELEAIVRRGGAAADQLLWIGSEGTAWQQTYAPVRGKGPYYNLLSPRVQEAMLRVVRELVAASARHPSFGGLALELSPHGYALLPGPEWGLDDATIAAFARDTKIEVRGQGADRFAQRAAFLGGEYRHEWEAWRAAQLTAFYRRVLAELRSVRPQATLYLAGGEMFAGEDFKRQLRPALPRRLTLADAALRVGIDIRYLSESEGIVLLRPEQIAPRWSLPHQAANLELGQMPDLDRYYQGVSVPGSLFFHPPQEVRLASFDEKSPFKPCYAFLASQLVPSGAQNRRRFVHSLATLDARAMFDGGWMLPLGQEDALRDLVAVYRRLPSAPFQTVGEENLLTSGQPVTIRTANHDGRTYAYLVNDAPFPATVRVAVDCNSACRMEELSGSRKVGALQRDGDQAWCDMELRPYDLVAVTFSAPGVRLSRPQVSWPREVQANLERQIGELGDRAAVLRSPPLLALLSNPSFDRTAVANHQVPGWTLDAPTGVTVELDKTVHHDGAQSVHLMSTGPVGGLVSQPFESPSTGRLSMSVWLRMAEGARQPPLRLVLQGKYRGRDFFRFAPVGQALQDQLTAPPLAAEWSSFLFQVSDLPLEGLSPIQVRFALLGAGEVWIDEVQLCSLDFTKKERVELFRLITPVDVKLQNGQIGDCVRLLEGYWPRFLVDHVPLQEGSMTRKTDPVTGASKGKEADRSNGLLDRVKSRVRF